MSVCAFNSLPNRDYSYLFIEAAFSSKSFSGKASLPVKYSYLLSFPEDKSVCLSKLYWAFVLLNFVTHCFNFLTNTHFYNKFFLNRNGLSDEKVVSFNKSDYGSLV